MLRQIKSLINTVGKQLVNFIQDSDIKGCTKKPHQSGMPNMGDHISCFWTSSRQRKERSLQRHGFLPNQAIINYC